MFGSDQVGGLWQKDGVIVSAYLSILWHSVNMGFFHAIHLVSDKDTLNRLGWVSGEHMTVVKLGDIFYVEQFVWARAFYGWREDSTCGEYNEEINEGIAWGLSGGGHIEIALEDRH